MSAERDLHGLALGVHGALVALHVLGIGYGWRRKNHGDALVHTLAAIFSVKCARHHLRKCA